MVEELHHIKWIAVAVSYVYYQEMGISYFESTLGRDFRQKQMWINACSGLMFDDEVARRSAAFQRVTFSITVDYIVSVSPFDVNR